MDSNDAPIGVFDSGIGGLSTLKDIRRALPAEDLIYVADSLHAPYGDKPIAFVEQRVETIARFLEAQGVKAIVVACNTATGIAVDRLRSLLALPIVAMEPAVKPAVRDTRSGKVAVLATTLTLSSRRFSDLVALHGHGVEVVAQPCPGLVEQVECGDLDGPATRRLVEHYVLPLVARGVDTLVLGCTHYSFLSPVIHDIAGPGVTVIDPSPAIARELHRRLEAINALAPLERRGQEQFFTTGSVERMQAVMSELWPGDVALRRVTL